MRRVVVFRHGIVINRYFLLPMERFFLRRGWEVRNATYPTKRKLIEEHALDLSEELLAVRQELDRQDEPYELYAVTHSMGGLVLRYALTHFEMPTLKRAVMLVPPNKGSLTARYFRKFPPYRWIFGDVSGRQLSEEPPGIFAEAGVPVGVDIGILAGDVPYKLWPVPLKRPHDGVVAVEESRLEPFPLKVLPYGHTPILFVRYAWEEAMHYLEHGRFLESRPSRVEAKHA